MARVPEASRANIYVLEKLFSARHLKSHGILVLTHWDGDIGEEEESLSHWMAGDQDIKDMIGRFAKVILTNNKPTGRGAYPESRKKCLEELVDFINQKSWKIQLRPVNTLELVVDLLRTFGDIRVEENIQGEGLCAEVGRRRLWHPNILWWMHNLLRGHQTGGLRPICLAITHSILPAC